MGLLNPLSLLYLLSLGVLILIYFRARPRPTLDVSSLTLFDEVPAPITKARWLRVDPLFWLEMLALGALSIAAAGLYLRVPSPPAHFRHHALVFDLSAAMGAREGGATRLELATREALEAVAAAPLTDSFSIISYALEARVVHPPTAGREGIRAALASLKPQAVATRPSAFSAALMSARQADTVDLFSDRIPPGQGLESYRGSARVRFHQVGSDADNLAIVALEPGSVRSAQGRCVLRNFSARPHLCELAVECGGEPVLHSAVMLEPRGQVVVPFGPLDRGGLLRARILSDDALAADNQRWAWAQANSSDKVLLISPDAQVRDDLARVLLSVNQNFAVTAFDPKQFEAGKETSDFSLAVMHDFYDARVKAASRLLIFPPQSGELPIKTTLAAAELSDRAGRESLAVPTLLGLTRVLAMPPWMETLASGSAGRSLESFPLAAFGRDRNGALGVIAFDVRDHLLLDPDRLDALIVAIDLVKRLSAPEDLQIVTTGAYATVAASGPARIVGPDGAASTAEPDRFGRIRFRPLEAGRYLIESPAGTARVFANYFDAAESDLSIKSPARPNAAAAAHGSGAPLTASRARSLDPALIALALLAFVVEAIVIVRAAARLRLRDV